MHDRPYNFIDFPLTTGAIDTITDDVLKHVTSDNEVCKVLSCLNPHSVAISEKDDLFKGALQSSDWLIADGVGVSALARLVASRKINRITGPEIFEVLLHHANQKSLKVFFLGSSEDTLRLIRERLQREFPNIGDIGSFSPKFTTEFSVTEVNEMVNTVNAFQPDILWVGMTAPKQEKWLSENKIRLDVKFAGAVGAAFDYFGGVHQRPNTYIRRLGLEWLIRILQNPKKMWRRTLISAPKYLWIFFRYYCK